MNFNQEELKYLTTIVNQEIMRNDRVVRDCEYNLLARKIAEDGNQILFDIKEKLERSEFTKLIEHEVRNDSTGE